MNKIVLLVSLGLGLLVASLAITLPSSGFNTNLNALLPKDSQDKLGQATHDHLQAQANQHLLLLFGNSDSTISIRAALAAKKSLEQTLAHVQVMSGPDGENRLMDLYHQHRAGLATFQRLQSLETDPADTTAHKALRALLSPGASARVTRFEEDPLGLYSQWLMDLAKGRSLPVEGDTFMARDNSMAWAILAVQLPGQEGVFSSRSGFIPAIDTAVAAATSAGAAQVLRSGFIFHADRARTQAKFETSLIGGISVVSIVLLAWFLFGSLKPIALVFIPVVSGVSVALAGSFLIFGQPHVLALVFGSTVIGIGVDYGIHYLSSSLLSDKAWNSHARAVQIRPDLLLALGTSLAAYALIAFLPIPVLRQMAFMALAGLSTACWAALTWLPFLTREKPATFDTAFSTWLAGKRKNCARILGSPMIHLGWLVLGLACIVGIFFRTTSDSPRELYAPSSELVSQQAKIDSMIFGGGSGEYLIVHADNLQATLEKEEYWRLRLETLIEKGRLQGYQALSRWLPSIQAQKNTSRLNRVLLSPHHALDKLAALLGDPGAAELVRKQWSKKAGVPAGWLEWDQFAAVFGNRPNPAEFLRLKTDHEKVATLIPLKGLSNEGRLVLEKAGNLDKNVQLFSPLRSLENTLQYYRQKASLLLLLAVFLATAIIAFKQRLDSWRIILPPVLAGIIALGLPVLWNQPVTLFSILGLILVLGMGLDYGIYLAAEPLSSATPFFTIFAASCSTILAFGVLSFSSTPALSAFGTSVGLGVCTCALAAMSFSQRK